MPNFTYTDDIPNPPNNPSTDVPDMKVNTNSIDGIIAVDHYSFNDNSGGYHKQITFPSENTPGAQVDPQSTIFTANAVTDVQITAIAKNRQTTQAQLYHKNANGIFPISGLRAFASVNFTPGIINTFNITAVTVTNSGKTFTFTFAANTVSSANYCYIFSTTSSSIVTSATPTALDLSLIFDTAPTGTKSLNVAIFQV